MKFLYAFVFVILNASIAHGQLAPAEVAAHLESTQKQGEADVRLFGFNLYRAELWTDRNGFSFDRPFALSLIYKRGFTARQLASRTVDEVAKLENVSVETHAGLQALEQCFRNVQPGDRITGVAIDRDRAHFYWNGQQTCEFTYPEFTRRFFGIWLDERTIDRRSRDRLLGQS